MTALPKALRVRGGAASSTSELRGHGLWWNSEDLAAAAKDLVGAAYVVDHSMSIEKIAGYVTKASAERVKIDLPTFKIDAHGWPLVDEKGNLVSTGEVKSELATRLTYEADLHERHPGYAPAAQHIISSAEAKATPHNSITLAGKKLVFDGPTNRLVLAGPFTVVHLGLVSIGASPPEEGVGVFGFEPVTASITEMREGIKAVDSTSVSMPSHIVLANASDLFIAFAEQHGYEHPLTVRAAAALGVDKEDAVKPPQKADASNSPSRPDVEQATPEVHAMPPDTPPATPATPAPAPAALPPEVMARLAKLDQLDAMQARLAEIDAREKNTAEAAVKAKREAIGARFPHVKVEALATFTTMAQLDAFEQSLMAASGGSPLPRKASTEGLVFANQGGDDKITADERERQAWLKGIDAQVAENTRPYKVGA